MVITFQDFNNSLGSFHFPQGIGREGWGFNLGRDLPILTPVGSQFPGCGKREPRVGTFFIWGISQGLGYFFPRKTPQKGKKRVFPRTFKGLRYSPLHTICFGAPYWELGGPLFGPCETTLGASLHWVFPRSPFFCRGAFCDFFFRGMLGSPANCVWGHFTL